MKKKRVICQILRNALTGWISRCNEIVGGFESVSIRRACLLFIAAAPGDAADPITDRPSLAPINYRAAAAHLAAHCIRNIVFRASLNLDSVFSQMPPPFAKRDAPTMRALRSYLVKPISVLKISNLQLYKKKYVEFIYHVIWARFEAYICFEMRFGKFLS